MRGCYPFLNVAIFHSSIYFSPHFSFFDLNQYFRRVTVSWISIYSSLCSLPFELQTYIIFVVNLCFQISSLRETEKNYLFICCSCLFKLTSFHLHPALQTKGHILIKIISFLLQLSEGRSIVWWWKRNWPQCKWDWMDCPSICWTQSLSLSLGSWMYCKMIV